MSKIFDNTTDLEQLLQLIQTKASGIDTSDATATKDDIMLGETAYVANQKITGTFTIEDEIAAINSQLAEITTALQNKAGVGSSGFTADEFNDSLVSGDIVINGTTVRDYLFYYCNKITSVSAPNVTTIKQWAFGYCLGITSLNLPEVTTINNGGLRNLHALKYLKLPKATQIDGYGLYYAIALEKLDLPVCTNLTNYSLGYAYKLQHLILRSDTVCTLQSINVFIGSTYFKQGGSGGYVYVPRNLISSYQDATNWSALPVTFRAIEDFPDICG